MTHAQQQARSETHPSIMSAAGEVGFFGKLPSHGDFLRRRVDDAFVRVWDAWLQESLAASREALGDRWLDVYLTSPAWRFACAPGAAGSAQVVGVMVPSGARSDRAVIEADGSLR